MEVYIIVLRILHIFAGIFWVGAALLTTFALIPMVKSVGGEGHKAMHLFLSKSRFPFFMPVTALVTTVAGLLLYERSSGGFDADWMRSANGIVLSIGVVAGILAFGHGIGLGRTSDKYAKAIETGNEAEINALFDRVVTSSYVSMGLLIITVLGMVSFRYV